MVSVGLNQARLSENEARNIYYDFGEKWRVDGIKHPLLFQTRHRALYNPLEFANPKFQPVFEPFRNVNTSYWQSLIFTPNQVRSQCQGVPSCEYDYMTSGRKEIALDTLSDEKKFEGVKLRGEKRWVSCGSLVKNKGVLKYPQGNNYLDGVTVTFNCKPEYFLHGTQQRTCVNGTWSPGWWVWCRSRAEETGLKWFTGIIVALLLLALIVVIFLYCYCLRIKAGKAVLPRPPRQRYQHNPHLKTAHLPAPPATKQPVIMAGAANPSPASFMASIPVMEHEPGKVGLHSGRGSGSSIARYNETSA